MKLMNFLDNAGKRNKEVRIEESQIVSILNEGEFEIAVAEIYIKHELN